MENINFTGDRSQGVFSNKLNLSFELEGNNVQLKEVTSYKGIAAFITRFFNIGIKITDAAGKCYVVNKKNLRNKMIESGLSTATIHSLVQKLKQGKEAPIATVKASQFHNAEQQNPLPTSHLLGHVSHSRGSLSQTIKEHNKAIDHRTYASENGTVSSSSVNSRVVSDYKLVKKNYSQEEIESFLPMPPHEDQSVNSGGKHIITKKLMDALKAGEKGIISHFSPKKMSSQQVTQILRDCVERQDRNGLRLLAQVLFNSGNAMESESIRTLRGLFFHPAVDEMCIARMMAKAFEDRKQDYRFTPLASNRKSQNPPFDNPSELVKISHGGGLENIRSFLANEIDGYQLESGAPSGLQVSINEPTRDESYAINGAWRHFDLPAVFTAEVERAHLHHANQAFEAGLSPPHVSSLKNVHIRLVENPLTIHSSALSNLDSAFGDEIAAAVEQSIREFNRHNNFNETPKEIHGLSVHLFATDLPPAISQGLNELKKASFISNSNVTTAEESQLD